MNLSQQMSHNKAKCLLCPHFCVLLDGHIGPCRARINRKGEIVLKDYGAISSMAVEPIEKKPIKHFLPGTKTLSVGGFGCNLHCLYCENERISQAEPHIGSIHLTPEEIVDNAIERDCQSVCMTFNEPTISIEFLLDLAKSCHMRALQFIIKTNAYVNSDPWDDICEVVDAMNIDIKGIYSIFEKMTGCRHINIYYKILSAILHSVHVEVSIPIYNSIDMRGNLYHFCEEMKELELDVPCHLLRIVPAHQMKDGSMTSKKEIDIAYDILAVYFKDVYA